MKEVLKQVILKSFHALPFKVQKLLFVEFTRLHPKEFSDIPEQTHLRRLLPHLGVDCVFDVGANAGQYAQMLRRQVGYKGQIISFEPIPHLAAEVRKLASADPLWSVEEVALSSANGTAEFKVMARDQFSSLGTPTNEDTNRFSEMNVPKETISVTTETLTSAVERLDIKSKYKRPFLKLDTQGFDATIVEGGRDVLPLFAGLQSELAIKRIYQESLDYREALSFYNDVGFELSALVPNNRGHFPHLIEIDCIMLRPEHLDNARKP